MKFMDTLQKETLTLRAAQLGQAGLFFALASAGLGPAAGIGATIAVLLASKSNANVLRNAAKRFNPEQKIAELDLGNGLVAEVMVAMPKVEIPADHPLQEAARDISAKMGIETPTLILSPFGRPCLFPNDDIALASENLDDSNLEKGKAIIAHEMRHIVERQSCIMSDEVAQITDKAKYIIAGVAALREAALVAFGHTSKTQIAMAVGTVALAASVNTVSHLLQQCASHAAEIVCDLSAVKTLGNPSATIEMLARDEGSDRYKYEDILTHSGWLARQFMSAGEKTIGHEATKNITEKVYNFLGASHPYDSTRIERVKKYAAENNIT